MLREYLQEKAAEKFAYGKWDCVHFVADWMGGEPRGKVLAWLKSRGYYEKVKDLHTYQRFILEQGVGDKEGLTDAFVRGGCRVSGDPSLGDIVIGKGLSLGIADCDYTGFFLHENKGIVRITFTNEVFLKCPKPSLS